MGRSLGLALLCFIMPPLAVAIQHGIGWNLALSLFLTIFGFWVLGVVHAIVTVLVLED